MVVQSSRYHQSKSLDEIYNLGLVPGLVFEKISNFWVHERSMRAPCSLEWSQDGHGSVRFGPVLTSPVSNPVPVSKVPVSNPVLPVPVPPHFDPSHPRTERSRGYFSDTKNGPKRAQTPQN